MMSASTKRRKKRDAELLAQWSGASIGTKVTVTRSNGKSLRTVTLCEPFALHAGAYVRVQGIDGNTHLRRVMRGWSVPLLQVHGDNQPPLSASAEKEIQRLRVAMVHAMDEANAALDGHDSKALRASLRRIHKSLKRALEKK